MSHEKYFFCSAIILTTHGLQNYAQSPTLIGVKNPLKQKYGLKVLPEKVLKSRSNQSSFENVMLLAWQIMEKLHFFRVSIESDIDIDNQS